MLDAHTCFLLERGMKTLVLRMKQHNENAARLAEFLSGHPAIAAVYYPGLSCHMDHEIAARQMLGFGGMLSFELCDPHRADPFLKSLCIVMPALSLGGGIRTWATWAVASKKVLTAEFLFRTFTYWLLAALISTNKYCLYHGKRVDPIWKY